MPQYFTRPENALQKANELLEVGRAPDALQALHDVIRARKHKTWTKVHEQIMHKHLELCVELRKPHIAKDGLFQYRNMCQQVNVKSLEDVILKYLSMASDRVLQARALAAETANATATVDDSEDVDDLDQAESPETLLLMAVSGEGAQDRADRTHLSPWLRFLWESYRQCLELLRNNSQVEHLYHKVARQAFEFCEQYKRRSEFKKLCDNLRTHWNQLTKMQSVSYAAKLTNPETISLHQETRLVQLDTAIKMALWQEAYKSIDDLNSLIQSTKLKPKPGTLANFYEKMIVVFLNGGSMLYHASALYRLFCLNKDFRKTFAADDAKQLATRTLVAILSIPPTASLASELARSLDMEELQQDSRRNLEQLLGLSAPPTRDGLLKEAIRLNIVNLASPVAQKLYHWLEVDGNAKPLRMASEVRALLEELSNSTSANEDKYKTQFDMYMSQIEVVTTTKLIKQISKYYQTMKMDRIIQVIPFFDRFTMERKVVHLAKQLRLQVHIDHRNDCFVFLGGETGRREGFETLANIYQALEQSVEQIESYRSEEVANHIKEKAHQYLSYHEVEAHKKNLNRRRMIEEYQLESERARQEYEQSKLVQQLKAASEQKMREDERLKIERKHMEDEQRRLEMERRRNIIITDKIERLKQTESGKKLIETLNEDELSQLDPKMIVAKQIDQQEKERQRQSEKLRAQEKKVDYLVRAVHLEEVKILADVYEDYKVKDREFWEVFEKERCERAEAKRELELRTHERLKRLEEEAVKFLEMAKSNNEEAMKARMEAWQKAFDDEKRKRLNERKRDRKEQRRQEHLKREAEKARAVQQMQEAEARPKLQERDDARRDRDEDRPSMADETSDWRRAPRPEMQRAPERRNDGPTGSASDNQPWRRAGPDAPAAAAASVSEEPQKNVYRPPGARRGMGDTQPPRTMGDSRGPPQESHRGPPAERSGYAEAGSTSATNPMFDRDGGSSWRRPAVPEERIATAPSTGPENWRSAVAPQAGGGGGAWRSRDHDREDESDRGPPRGGYRDSGAIDRGAYRPPQQQPLDSGPWRSSASRDHQPQPQQAQPGVWQRNTTSAGHAGGRGTGETAADSPSSDSQEYSWSWYFDYCVQNYQKTPTWNDYTKWFTDTYKHAPAGPKESDPIPEDLPAELNPQRRSHGPPMPGEPTGGRPLGGRPMSGRGGMQDRGGSRGGYGGGRGGYGGRDGTDREDWRPTGGAAPPQRERQQRPAPVADEEGFQPVQRRRP